ncbi:MAG TPA: hypothetical protein VMG31_10290 [Verrucomicrobiae bacterium]|nr:hypothetical protein [Verrucomicrobiae bacterium]
MRRIAIFATLLLACAALPITSGAQNANPQPGPSSVNRGSARTPAPTARIAPGSVIPVQLTKTVDAKKAKTGDQVVATVTQDMKTKAGQVVVPKNTEVIGHVTEAQARGKQQKESEVGIAFDHAVVKGDDMQMPMSIQAVIASPADNSNNAPAANPGPPAMGGSAAPSPMGNERPGATGGSTQAPASQPNYPQDTAGEAQSQPAPRPAINGTTEGVIGISHLQLETTQPNPAQGSLLTSEKSNVKIEKGTLMLLRVNP